jgi:hypothetical protein
MQLCDTTLYDWLRYRDQTIIEETSNQNKNIFYSLNHLGQQQCWHIFKQLLTAVQVKIQLIKSSINLFFYFSIFILNHLFIVI